jgi:hypothetical protein
VLTMLFAQLSANTTLIQPSTAAPKSVEKWEKKFCDKNSHWGQWIGNHGKCYTSVEQAVEDTGIICRNTGFAFGPNDNPENKYAKNTTQRRLLTWFDSHTISKEAVQQLLQMLKSKWWCQADVISGSMSTLRYELDQAAMGMVHSLDVSVPADGPLQKVVFYYRNPVECLQLVSAHSMCHTSHACTFAHTHTTTPYPGGEFCRICCIHTCCSVPQSALSPLIPPG